MIRAVRVRQRHPGAHMSVDAVVDGEIFYFYFHMRSRISSPMLGFDGGSPFNLELWRLGQIDSGLNEK